MAYDPDEIDWKELMPDPPEGVAIKLNIRPDVPTANGRVYPRAVLERAMEQARRKIRQGVLLVHADAPLGGEPDLNDAVGIVNSIHLVDDEVRARINIMDTTTGMAVRELLKHGAHVKWTMGCTGKLKDGHVQVEDFKVDYINANITPER